MRMARYILVHGAAPTGTEIHDHALVLFEHARKEGAQDIGRTFDVHVDDLAELLRADFPERGVLVDDAGVVDDEVGGAVALVQPGGPGLHLLVGGHVHYFEVVAFGELAAQGGDGFGVAAAAEDGMAEAGEGFRHGAAQAARDAGNDDDSFLVFIHRLVPS